MIILYVLFILFVCRQLLKRPVWVRHLAMNEEWDDILKEGFRKPTGEQLLIDQGVCAQSALGQAGGDRVSFSFIKDKPYYNTKQMVRWMCTTGHKAPKRYELIKTIDVNALCLTYRYFKLPLAEVIIARAQAHKTNWGLYQYTLDFGISLETSVDRSIVNKAIFNGEVRDTKPSDYHRGHWVLIVDACINAFIGQRAYRQYLWSQIKKYLG